MDNPADWTDAEIARALCNAGVAAEMAREAQG